MKRRNFLKLFGLIALPVSTLASASAAEPSKAVRIARIGITADLYAAFNVYVGDDEEYNHILIYYAGYDGTATETYLVPENELITVRAPTGKSVSFYPQWDTVSQQFKTVDIHFKEKKIKDIFIGFDEDGYEQEHITGWMTASCNGKDCTESFEPLDWAGEKGTFPPF